MLIRIERFLRRTGSRSQVRPPAASDPRFGLDLRNGRTAPPDDRRVELQNRYRGIPWR